MNLLIDPAMPRRRFIKIFTLTTAASCLADKPWSARVLAEVQPLRDPNNGLFQLKITDYPALANDFGSVRLGTSRVLGSRQTGLFPPMLVNRAPGGEFHALSAACTHEDCVLPVLNAANRFTQCPCHGSRFAVDGKVLRTPARDPLEKYVTAFDGKDTLTIEIPRLGFTVTTTQVQASPARLELKFLAFQNLEYEVQARASLDEPWQMASFALNADGPLDKTVFAGADDFAKLYVPAQGNGAFYAVAMKVKAV